MDLHGGSADLDTMLSAYHMAWHQLIAENDLEIFKESVVPTTISWKVSDKKTLFGNLEHLANHTEQLHVATVNDRFIASIVLKEPYDGMQIVKILERREDSEDPLGLDSIDFLVEDSKQIFDIASRAKGCKIEKEHNPMHAWLSLRFGSEHQFEAKFVEYLVLRVAQTELAISEKAILASLGMA
jgi:hypothetical protein